ncbi:MAG: hypothetical protein ACT4QC_10695 [Planctomycetaceae bacterium]
MFTADNVRQRIKQQPFVPLRIRTSSGETYDVTHPDLVLVGRNLLVIGSPAKENPWQIESFDQVSLLHVTALENLPARRRSGRNGRH